MARFLLACYPVSGHLHPNIAVAHALQARGHQVAVYSGQMARPIVEGEGFTYFPYDPQMDATITHILVPKDERSVASDISVEARPLARLGRIRAALREWYLATLPQQVADLRQAVAAWQPDGLVTDIPLFGPIVVLHETLSIPVAVFCVLPACPLPGPDAPTWGRGLPPLADWRARLRSRVERAAQNWVTGGLRRELDRLRRGYGLGPLPTENVMAFAGRLPLFMVAGTPELDYNRRDLPSTVHYVGPCLWHRPSSEPPAVWIAQLQNGRPVVHVTEGTIHVGQPVVLSAAAQGLANLEMEVVMTTGKHRQPAELGLAEVAANIRVEQYVSHGDLFPHTDLVVTTGGAGTVLTALQAGVPLVVVPTGWDLPEIAERVVAAGVGVRLDPSRCSPATLRSAVEAVLGNPAYRRRAAAVGAALAQRGGPNRVGELLEQLIHPSA